MLIYKYVNAEHSKGLIRIKTNTMLGIILAKKQQLDMGTTHNACL